MPEPEELDYTDSAFTTRRTNSALESRAEIMRSPLPAIQGYRKLTPHEVGAINELKALEQQIFASLMRMSPAVLPEPRWLAIAKTHIEQGFMALTRAIAKPSP